MPVPAVRAMTAVVAASLMICTSVCAVPVTTGILGVQRTVAGGAGKADIVVLGSDGCGVGANVSACVTGGGSVDDSCDNVVKAVDGASAAVLAEATLVVSARTSTVLLLLLLLMAAPPVAAASVVATGFVVANVVGGSVAVEPPHTPSTVRQRVMHQPLARMHASSEPPQSC
jgi:hypothetical protein